MKIRTTLTRLIAAFVILSLLSVPAFATKALPPDLGADLTFEVEIIGPRRFANSHSQPALDSTASESGESLVSEDITHVDASGYADDVLRLVNIEREAVGLSPLSGDSTLATMANIRAGELLQNFSHTRPDGTKCATVFEEVASTLEYNGENASYGRSTPAEAVNAWMNSDGHRENILRKDSQYLGVGIAQTDNGVLYWVQIFAK